MANRIDIELTSARDDDSYTWRAAGARQPRGVVTRSLVPPAAKVGDVLRAEVEVEIDGITVVAILPSKDKAEVSGVIEYIGPERPAAGVTTVLAGRGDRRGRGPGDRDRDRDRDRRPRRDGERRDGERRDRPSDREGRPPRERAARDSREGRDAGDRGGRPATSREGSERRPRPSSEGARPDARRGERPPARGARRGPVRFEPGTEHRDALFATLTPEQRPIAEHLAMGGLPAVRKALAEEQQRAKAENRPVASGEPIIALAEQLLPDVKAAVWLDRAEASIAKIDEITLRDLRAAVVGAAPRDEAGRALERTLREHLDRRVTKLRADWEQHLTQALDDGRVLQALRLSAKPPEPAARFPGSLVMRLAEQASAAMTEEVGAERWLALLEAAVASPVRRQIKPAGMPKDPSGEVERQSRAAASRVPALAKLLGMPIPPPPQPVAGERPVRPPRPRPPRPARSSRPPRPPAEHAELENATGESEPGTTTVTEAPVEVVEAPVAPEPGPAESSDAIEPPVHDDQPAGEA